MKFTTLIVLVFGIVQSCYPTSFVIAQYVHLSFSGDPGDWISQGTSHDLTYTIIPNYDLVVGESSGAYFELRGSSPFTEIDFSCSSNNVPITPGVYSSASNDLTKPW
jgi:hypothetical protein